MGCKLEMRRGGVNRGSRFRRRDGRGFIAEEDEESEAVGRGERDLVTGVVVDAGLTVHKALGPGLLESAYQQCLAYELRKRGIRIACQVLLPVLYDGIRLDAGYRLDIVVEERVIVEIKSVERLTPLHQAQLMTYLKLSGYPVGLLINFNVLLFKQGVKRLVV